VYWVAQNSLNVIDQILHTEYQAAFVPFYTDL